MENIDESITNAMKFLKKLNFVIQNEAKFTFIDSKVVDKSRIDDIVCCFEASLPSEYKKLIKSPTHKMYRSIAMYHSLRSLIFRKFIFSSSLYLIKFGLVQSHVANLVKIMESDIRRLYADL